jgi:hypothetical protein
MSEGWLKKVLETAEAEYRQLPLWMQNSMSAEVSSSGHEERTQPEQQHQDQGEHVEQRQAA